MRRSIAIATNGLCLQLLLLSGSLAAETQSQTVPADLSKWGLHCFCLGAVQTPQRIVRLDNNGQILYEARIGFLSNGVNASGLAVSDSQLELLREYNLLEKKDGYWKTNFPTLGPQELAPIRKALKARAHALAPKIRSHVLRINSQLSQQNLADFSYAIIFGFALDGIVWDKLREQSLLPETTVDIAHPHWRGAFWAIYPEREDAPGTNEITVEGASLVLTWTHQTSVALNALEGSPELDRYLLSLARGERVPSVVHDKNGADWSLAENGSPLLPVVRKRPGDPIYDESNNLASIVATELIDEQSKDSHLFSAQTSREQRLLITAHEFIWDVLEELVSQRIVGASPAQSSNEKQRQCLRSCLFVILN